MTLIELALVFVGALLVGVLGGTLGVGGGIFLVPFLVFTAAVRPIEAVAVSLFCIIGTSAGSASVAIKTGEANVGLSLLLEPGLIIGAVVSSALAHQVSDGALLIGFSALVFIIGVGFFVQAVRNREVPTLTASHRPARFFDGVSSGQPYRVPHPTALALSTPLAGITAGLFGIGGGVVTVPLLTVLGRVPLKAATATSSLSLMVSAAAAGAVHLAHGVVPAPLAAAALCGVLPGGLLGARLQGRVSERSLKVLFALLAVSVAVMTAWKAR
jgi:uncharacterized membrane protein YfcA